MSQEKVITHPVETMRNAIFQKGDLSDGDWEKIKAKITHRVVSKNEHLLAEGEICNRVWLLTKGLIRCCSYDDDNLEITRCFAVENQFIFSLSSFLNNSPSHELLIALEDTEVLELSKEDFTSLRDEIPSLKDFYIRMLEEAYLLLDYHNYALQNFAATKRYHKLILEDAPGLLQRVPQVYLASFLGISPETLSRIRKK